MRLRSRAGEDINRVLILLRQFFSPTNILNRQPPHTLATFTCTFQIQYITNPSNGPSRRKNKNLYEAQPPRLWRWHVNSFVIQRTSETLLPVDKSDNLDTLITAKAIPNTPLPNVNTDQDALINALQSILTNPNYTQPTETPSHKPPSLSTK